MPRISSRKSFIIIYNFICTFGDLTNTFIKLCVSEDQVLEAVTVKTYNGCSLMIENIQFCHKNSTTFIITQFDCTILLYNVYQVGKNKLLILSLL